MKPEEQARKDVEREMWQALTCLYLAVPEHIARDVEAKVRAAWTPVYARAQVADVYENEHEPKWMDELAALRERAKRAEVALQAFINAPPAQMSSSLGLVTVDSNGMRQVVDALAAAEADVAWLRTQLFLVHPPHGENAKSLHSMRSPRPDGADAMMKGQEIMQAWRKASIKQGHRPGTYQYDADLAARIDAAIVEAREQERWSWAQAVGTVEGCQRIIDNAIAEEREACAMVCDLEGQTNALAMTACEAGTRSSTIMSQRSDEAYQCAAAIRARGK